MQQELVLTPAESVRSVLVDPGGTQWLDPPTRRRVGVLERESDRVVELAADSGVKIDYIGVHPLFSETRTFAGPVNDWLLGPANPQQLTQIVPAKQLADLRKLLSGGVHFPVLYEAHEVEPGKIQEVVGLPADHPLPDYVGPEHAEQIVEAPPLPVSTIDMSNRLNAHADRLLAALASGAKAVGSAAVLPVRAVGHTISSAAKAIPRVLDPIIIGAIPSGRPVEGAPAAFYLLARWAW
jgi:hypothetical protein